MTRFVTRAPSHPVRLTQIWRGTLFANRIRYKSWDALITISRDAAQSEYEIMICRENCVLYMLEPARFQNCAGYVAYFDPTYYWSNTDYLRNIVSPA